MIDINGVTAYFNPNTLQWTSNKENAAYKTDKTQIKFAELIPINIDWEKETSGRTGNLKLAEKTTLDKNQNSITFGRGATVTLDKGFTITLGSKGFAYTGDVKNNREGYEQAITYCLNLTELIRCADGQIDELYLSYGKYSEQARSTSQKMLEALRACGIDTTRDFYINGTAFGVDSNGVVQKKETMGAQAAYEKQIANNNTYRFADERTRGWISHLTEYYLPDVPEEIKQAWNETLENTGINPFPSGYTSTLSQLAMEQDFATGGNDNIFGNSMESAEQAVRSILDRIEYPLGEQAADMLAKEKEFYTAFLNNIKNMA